MRVISAKVVRFVPVQPGFRDVHVRIGLGRYRLLKSGALEDELDEHGYHLLPEQMTALFGDRPETWRIGRSQAEIEIEGVEVEREAMLEHAQRNPPKSDEERENLAEALLELEQRKVRLARTGAQTRVVQPAELWELLGLGEADLLALHHDLDECEFVYPAHVLPEWEIIAKSYLAIRIEARRAAASGALTGSGFVHFKVVRDGDHGETSTTYWLSPEALAHALTGESEKADLVTDVMQE